MTNCTHENLSYVERLKKIRGGFLYSYNCESCHSTITKDRLIVQFVIPGKPKGKAGRIPHPTVPKVSYFPTSTTEYINYVRLLYGKQYGNSEMFLVMKHDTRSKFSKSFKVPLFLHIRAFYPIPVTTSKKRRVSMLAGKIIPVVKPDLKNIQAIIEDALNKRAFHDDSQIACVSAKKSYSEQPRVEVKIWEIGNE